MPIKKKVYAVYLIKRNYLIFMFESSREHIKEKNLKRETVYERNDEWFFYTTDVSSAHIKEVFKQYFNDYCLKIISEIDKYKGDKL